MEFNVTQFEETKARGEDFYKNISAVYCPYFKEKVSFNTQGLDHLKFKLRRKARLPQDQYMRFKLLHLAPLIITASNTLQGIWETKHFEDIRNRNRTDTLLTPVTYYEFIAIIGHTRVKVIIKQIESGQKFFWSLIPYWKIDSQTRKKKLHNGQPEHD